VVPLAGAPGAYPGLLVHLRYSRPALKHPRGQPPANAPAPSVALAFCLTAAGVLTDVPAGLTARLDRRRFDVIVANLVGNALRHGGPPVTVQASIPRTDDGGQLALLVRDHGPGLPPAALPHVFDRFYKADSAGSRSAGSGLGLAIAWENARLHGGSADAANHPGGGALFTVRLPMSRPEPSRLTQPNEEPATLTRS